MVQQLFLVGLALSSIWEKAGVRSGQREVAGDKGQWALFCKGWDQLQLRLQNGGKGQFLSMFITFLDRNETVWVWGMPSWVDISIMLYLFSLPYLTPFINSPDSPWLALSPDSCLKPSSFQTFMASTCIHEGQLFALYHACLSHLSLVLLRTSYAFPPYHNQKCFHPFLPS
jgi:hypothetical protein